MPRYQLRLRPDQSLTDILDGCVEAVWGALARSAEFSSLLPKDKEALRADLKKVAGAFIVRYDVCGGQALCEDSMEPLPENRNPDPAVAPRPAWQADEVVRLAVNVSRDLDGLIESLEAAVYREFFRTPERAHLAAAMKPVLGRIFRDALVPHLFRNVTCGSLELCKSAKRGDPWVKVLPA